MPGSQNFDDNFLREMNARQLWHPMAHPAESQANLPVILTSGQGVRVTDIDGNEVVDAVGGLWNVNLGYSCEPVKQAIADQLAALPYANIFRGVSNDKIIRLAHETVDFFAPDGMARAFFTSGGSDSVETALRLARQYHKVNGAPSRTKFLSLKKGYHGTHFGGASVNGNANFRTQYEPLMAGCFHIPAPYSYRNPFNETDPAALAASCIAALEDEIRFQGAGTVAAFIMEPVLGAGGVIPPHHSFMPMVREVCDRHGILLIADEVITGFGRTGAWSGSRLWGVKPDMMCIAKAITSGYFPLGATMINERIADAFEADSSGTAAIGHGYTYSGHPVGAAAALATLAETRHLDVVTNAAARGTQLFDGMISLAAHYPVVGDVRGGHGLMAAFELVCDREAKTPIDGKLAVKMQKSAYAAGALIRVSGPNVILSPSLIIEEADIDITLGALEAGLKAIS
ncbi:MAG: aminotransferase class III-fold pyridoxal phosphate-dependent enzyme [Pseudomonadota bacterium]|nr:aminotransferase class III-fold pyridoxal phosphate-dependent enzyme [Pseudomonadota bacterium]MEC8672542.1 aminotransferase class III-fold pyridoxal phosphate-dependent enzyme [Pseudomonadota bacterium]